MEKFWLEDPTWLIRSLQIFPREEMYEAQRLNALTRLVIIIAIILIFIPLASWIIFLISGLVLIVLLYWLSRRGHNTDTDSVPEPEPFGIRENYLCKDYFSVKSNRRVYTSIDQVKQIKIRSK